MKSERIRILYICDIAGWGGSTLSMKNLLEALPSNAYEFSFLIKSKGPVYEEMHQKGYDCIVFPFSNYCINYNHSLRGFLQFLHDCTVYFLVNPICVWYVSKRMANKIDIVHSNSSAVTFGQNIANRIEATHIWHIREFIDLFDSSILLKGRKYLYNKLHHSDSTISITNPVAKHWNLEGKKGTYIIHDAVRHVDDICYQKEKDKFFVFCCGYLNDFKGADYAVESFCKSGLHRYGYELVLVGDYSESYHAKLLQISEAYNSTGSISFTGFLKETELKKLLSKASCFLQCSKIEGLGRTVIEAMFYGCPVVARNNGGTLDIIEDGRTGFLYDTQDECIMKMKQVVTEDMEGIVLEAQREAVVKFSIENYGEKMDKLYRKLAGQKK